MTCARETCPDPGVGVYLQARWATNLGSRQQLSGGDQVLQCPYMLSGESLHWFHTSGTLTCCLSWSRYCSTPSFVSTGVAVERPQLHSLSLVAGISGCGGELCTVFFIVHLTCTILVLLELYGTPSCVGQGGHW